MSKVSQKWSLVSLIFLMKIRRFLVRGMSLSSLKCGHISPTNSVTELHQVKKTDRTCKLYEGSMPALMIDVDSWNAA